MKKISCPHCGNTRGFREWTLVHCYNYFVLKEDGKVLKDMVEEKPDDENDSVVICEVCRQELKGDVYHQLLDNYTETIFEEF